MKRGQISLFILIGAVIFITMIFLLLLMPNEEIVQPSPPDEITSFITAQLDRALQECVTRAGLWNAIAGDIRIKASVKDALEKCVSNTFLACLNQEDIWRRLGVFVEHGAANVSVLLAGKDLSASLTMPTTIGNGDSLIQRDQYSSALLPVRLRELAAIRQAILEKGQAAPTRGDIDLTLLGTLDVNSTVRESADGVIYEIADGQSRLNAKQYYYAFAAASSE